MNKSLLMIVILALSSMIGCASSGPRFVEVDRPSSEMAVLYFYRKAKLNGGGAKIPISDNGQPLTKMLNGQYQRHIIEPGLHLYTGGHKWPVEPLAFEAEAGQTYFVRVFMDVGASAITWRLYPVSEELAVAQMKECCKGGN